MKQILLSVCVLLALVSGAQMKQGKVVYERTMQMQWRARNPEVADQLPRSRKDHFELTFGANRSLWQVIPGDEGEGGTFSAPGVVVRMAGMNDVTYYNFEEGRRLDQREMFDREFLVEDSIRKLSWKLSDETRSILGHTARKATASRVQTRPRITMENGEMKREMVTDTTQVVAWFTSEIPVPAGPPEFGGQLPGLILELEANNGRVLYKAIEVSPKVNVAGIKEPRGGKRLTAAEFDKERDALMEEMRKNNPGGNMRIRMD